MSSGESSTNSDSLVNHGEWDKPVSKEEFDRARYHHDVFNTVAMIPVLVFIVLDINLWVFTTEWSLDWKEGPWFWHMWTSSVLFTIVDSIWIYRVPHCVRTPKTILEHHFMMILYLAIPAPFPFTRPFVAPILSVEVNSFFSFLRRMAWKAKHWSGDIFHVLFLITWIITRVIVYPAILYTFARLVYIWVRPPYELFMISGLIGLPAHAYFCYMNCVWTQQLFTPILRNLWNQLLGKKND